MPQGIENLFSGLLQGFGGELLNHRKQQFEKAQQEHQDRLAYVGQALKLPNLSEEARAQLIKDWGQMMTGKGGSKEEKQAVGKISEMLSPGGSVATGKQTTSMNIPGASEKPKMEMTSEQLPIAKTTTTNDTRNIRAEMTQSEAPPISKDKGDLASMTPNSMPITKPEMRSTYMSPEEMRQREAADTYSSAYAQQSAAEAATAPRREMDRKSQEHKAEITAQARLESQRLAIESRETLDVNKRYEALKAQFQAENPGVEVNPQIEKELKGEAGKQITEMVQAKLDDMKEKREISKNKFKLDLVKFEETKKNIESMIANRNISAGQRQQRLGLQTKALQIAAIGKQIDKDYAEFDKWVGVFGSTKSTKAADEAIRRLNAIEDEMNNFRGQLDSVTSDLGEPIRTSATKSMSPKTNSRPYKIVSNDGGKTKYKFYGYKADGSPDMEQVP